MVDTKPIIEPPYPIAGIRLGSTRAGIRYADRRDLAIVEVAPGSTCAAVFTQNAFRAAPVVIAQQHLLLDNPHYLVINTGNANAGTGCQGLSDAEATCSALAELTGCLTHQVLPFSTGVIGEPLPVKRLITGLPEALATLDSNGWIDAAHSIMTTDTRPKLASRQTLIDGQPITVTGMAKGAGMIRPDMATMLAFIATDASLDQKLLQTCLMGAVEDSFNSVSVDGDTSTNDACVLLATGRDDRTLAADSTAFSEFKTLLHAVCVELAQAIIRDGEGATKFITLLVEEGANRDECRRVAYTIAHSPLVKTAFFASDPNWGRILAAVGRAGLPELDLTGVSIYLDEVCIVRAGERAADYTEDQGQSVMNRTDITVRIQLSRGTAQSRIWTTDLSLDYVRINAEYRT
ncbi:MAG: bifunctional glutamate N-acetyltransferase/amino-acid acetyltransferase ArgJ [Gammaproteobacteria bacterium]|nr:bifunctional glutamate N-acetyltransferase/amino-acid acetyltransferase ArgJ [Gammaproteobacteria bacterium]MCP5423738.1 bifunctional glutamate N-acetyltransferase/amino-acid acetyltransferase ArgJ [Gammaproteobacteria bacterium]MCP5459680.1 bifunctional glutamate N-acetyltransferase/amino-acid acetyltransferase ArgJ [Gammaproteobacteria bacterium]